VKGGGAGGRSSAAAGRASGSLVSHWSPGVAPEVTVEGAPPLYVRWAEGVGDCTCRRRVCYLSTRQTPSSETWHAE
jgi:hypothetical protein